ncbi:MAG: ATP-binding protein, partial [Oscillospiraceae bacterium]|nr:ATP-binding protein [Oscillospiraceae bacterium]
RAGAYDKSQFTENGVLDMDRILEKFVVHFNEITGDKPEKFLEEKGREYFLLYLRPIINGTGNYYIEAQTRDHRRMDVVVDYLGEQFIIELKIWHGDEYNRKGEEQLCDYLEKHHLKKGYLVSFCFNRDKESGVKVIHSGDKTIVEAVV